MTRHTIETAGEHLWSGIPSSRVGTPEDVAGTALYLASRAGAFTNGATITIDGGKCTRLLPTLNVTESTSFRYAGQHALVQTVGTTLLLWV